MKPSHACGATQDKRVMALLSPGALAAEDAKRYLEKAGLLCEKECGSCEFYVSDSVENFTALGSTFLGKTIDGKVHLEVLD